MLIDQGLLNSLRRIVTYRQRILDGVCQDVKQRYVGSLFGMAWAILVPLLQLGIYAGLYYFVFKVRPSGLSECGYVMLVFSGLVPLMAFNEIVTSAMNSLASNKSLLLNTVFPAEFIPLRAGLAGHVTSLIGLAMTMCAGYLVGQTSWHALLLAPLFWILLVMFAMGIGWILSLIAIVARDIQYGIGILLMLAMILSPFAYTAEMVPRLLKPLIYLNPLSYFVLTFQSLICYGTWPNIYIASGAAALALISFLAGFYLFQRVKYVFFDYA